MVKKIFLGGIFIIALVVLGIAFAIPFVFSETCSNDVISVLVSPNNENKLVLFERSCGATTDFSTQVSIIKENLQPDNENGNIFVADCDHGKAPRASWGGPEVKISWLNSDTVKIVYHKDARVFLEENCLSDIEILYEKFE